jgi:hypothetical protein
MLNSELTYLHLLIHMIFFFFLINNKLKAPCIKTNRPEGTLQLVEIQTHATH